MVGFDKLAHTDVQYCADPSIKARMKRRPYLFLLPRYRAYSPRRRRVRAGQQDQGAAAEPAAIERILERLAHRAGAADTLAADDCGVAPPSRLSPQRRRREAAPKPRFHAAGLGLARHRGGTLSPRDWIAACVALREFPTAKLVIAGLSPTGSSSARAVAAQAGRLGIGDSVRWVGHREDIPELMAAADLLVHPARNDTTGTVILEAVVNALPVIASAACGYAQHVASAEAGIVVEEPFAFAAFKAALAAAEDAGRRARWSAAAAVYGEQPFLYEGRARAADIIVAAAAERAQFRKAAIGETRAASRRRSSISTIRPAAAPALRRVS